MLWENFPRTLSEKKVYIHDVSKAGSFSAFRNHWLQLFPIATPLHIVLIFVHVKEKNLTIHYTYLNELETLQVIMRRVSINF
jgi:hypothetical protein